MMTRSHLELARTIPTRELDDWQEWEATQRREVGHVPRLLALVALLLVIPALGWVLYVPVHVDAFVLWVELTILFAAQRTFERRAILHPTEFTVMVALYMSLSSVARLIDYLRTSAAIGQPPQPFEIAYRLVGAALLFVIGYTGGRWMARDARRRFDRWRKYR
jgi:hypothetical protein